MPIANSWTRRAEASITCSSKPTTWTRRSRHSPPKASKCCKMAPASGPVHVGLCSTHRHSSGFLSSCDTSRPAAMERPFRAKRPEVHAGPLRTALVGCGKVSAAHAQAFSCLPQSKFVAVCSRSLDRAQALARRFGVRAYTDIRQMIEGERVDVVSITTPHPRRTRLRSKPRPDPARTSCARSR